jgi:NADH dehydrogenase
VANAFLEVDGWPGIWAIGDCAAIPNAATGKLAPPTAQFAQREGKLAAHNIVAQLRQQPMRPFDFAGLGQFVSLGRRSAVAEVFGAKVAGFPAWWLWRTVYLSKLPGLARKMRVSIDWTLDLLFGRDITQLPLARAERVGRAHYEAGDVIVEQGDVGDLFYVIVEGKVDVVREERDGTRAVLARLEEGDFFGEMALLSGSRRRTATVLAITPVNVLTLGRDDFTLLVNKWDGLRATLRAAAGARAG